MAHAVPCIIPHRDSLSVTTVEGTAAFLIAATGGYQCEVEACIPSFLCSFTPQASMRPKMHQALSWTLEAQRCRDRTDQGRSWPCGDESGVCVCAEGDKATGRAGDETLACHQSAKVTGLGVSLPGLKSGPCHLLGQDA